MTRETFQAPVDGGVLAGYVDGAGPPVLVLHGGPGLSVSIVDGLVADLLPAYRVATFQQRGIEPSTTDGVLHDRRGGCRRRRGPRPPRLGHGVRRGELVGRSPRVLVRGAGAASAAGRSRRRPARGRRRRRQRRVRGRDGAAHTGGGPGACGRAGPPRATGGGVGGAGAGEPAAVLAGLLRRTRAGVADVGDRAVDPGVLRTVRRPAGPAAGAGAVAAVDRRPRRRRRRGGQPDAGRARRSARPTGCPAAGRRSSPVRATSRGTRRQGRCVRRWTGWRPTRRRAARSRARWSTRP